MRSKLLAVAIAAGLGVASFHVAADPAPAKKTHSTSQDSQAASKNAEIEALKAQLGRDEEHARRALTPP